VHPRFLASVVAALTCLLIPACGTASLQEDLLASRHGLKVREYWASPRPREEVNRALLAELAKIYSGKDADTAIRELRSAKVGCAIWNRYGSAASGRSLTFVQKGQGPDTARIIAPRNPGYQLYLDSASVAYCSGGPMLGGHSGVTSGINVPFTQFIIFISEQRTVLDILRA